ncbi:alpha/beta hydrolase family protein [Alteromonas sp. AMM-1]|uniref:alpha/beta hydrolase family protein n=1 Tax=Alteromonas sp. AMM-1 TaxID=3394233 RepID=UPI0039A721DE
MKKIITALLLLCAYIGSVNADSIPLESFAKHAQYQSVKISPTGEYLAFAALEEGKRVIAVVQRSPAKLLNVIRFRGNEQAGSYFWANDERLVVGLQITLGYFARPMGTGEYYAVNYDGSKGRNIFGYRSEEGVAFNPVFESPSVLDMMWDDDKHILIQGIPVNNDSSNLTNVYRLNIYNGRKRQITRSPLKQAQMLSDNNQQVRYAVGATAKEGKNVLQIYYREDNDADWSLQKEFDNDDDSSFQPLGFTADNKGIYIRSDHQNGRDGIYRYDLNSEEMTMVYQHDRVDISDFDIDRNNVLYAVQVEPDYSYTEVVEPAHPIGKWYPPLIKAFNGARVQITSATADFTKLTVFVSSDRDPGSFYLFDATKGGVEQLAKVKPWIDPKQIGSGFPVAIQARDGYTNYAYVSTPVGKEKNLPLVIIPHGGPHGPRDYWAYDDDVAFLNDNGFATIKVNFRGSGGYGNAHESAGYGEWGGLMIDDMTDAVKWAIKDGLADPDRICIYGASYGGYASLMSVVKEPDLYKCAVGYVGIYDMAMMFEKGDIPDSRFGQNFLKQVLSKDEDKLDAFSPARHVDKIKAELFIVHGEQDERAHYDHALLLKSKLDEAGKSYEWMTRAEEGHGFYKEENRQALYEAMLTFLNKHIGEK